MKILVKNYNIKTPEELIKACDGNEFLARILFNRGIDTYEKAVEILDSNRYTPFNVLDFPRIDEWNELPSFPIISHSSVFES